jgi:TonB family C-terminal domain
MKNHHQHVAKLLIVICLLFSSNFRVTKAATSFGLTDYFRDTVMLTQSAALKPDTVLAYADKMPEFPGGRDSMMHFIQSHIEIPEEVSETGINGRVFVQFVVNKQGKVIHPKVLKGIGKGCDEAALRLVNSFPIMSPAVKDGNIVDVYYTLPITFKVEREMPLTFVEQQPQFPGGLDGMMRFLSKNIKYPSIASKYGISGKVYAQFVVSKLGKLYNVKILRGIGGGCDEEAVRVIKLMPDWIPGRQNGKPVSVYFVLPISFQLK